MLGRTWNAFRADAGLGIIGSPSPDSDFWYGPNGLGFRSGAGPNVSPGTAIRLSAVFACIRVITETYGSLPVTIYRERKSGGREPATDHPAQELFLTPNDWQTGMEFFETIQSHLELRGNAYALKVPCNGRAIGQLVPLHPDRVRVYLLPNNRLRYEVTAYSTGRVDRYTQDEIVHFRGCWSSDGIMGMSMVAAMAEVIGVGLAQQEHRGRYFRNSAIPGISIETVKMTDEARKEMTDSISEAFSGENAFKVFAPPPGAKVQMLGLTNKDSQLIEASSATRTEICAALRVPPHKIADLTRGTFSNIEQQNIEFATDCIRPRVVRNERRLDRDVVDSLRAFESVSGDYFAVFNMDALYRGDMKSRYEAYAAAIPWMLRNEMRAAEGKNPIDGLDEPLVAVNMETVSQAERRSKANASAAMTPDTGDDNKKNESDQQDTFDRSGGGTETPDEDQQDEEQKAMGARIRGIVMANAGRIVRREVKTLRRLASKSEDGNIAIEGQVWDFYRDLAPVVAETMAIPESAARSYCNGHAKLVATSRSTLLGMAIDKIEEESAPALAELALSAHPLPIARKLVPIGTN
jgi:HK97 family phage portal protein